jgi:hypothetical protein
MIPLDTGVMATDQIIALCIKSHITRGVATEADPVETAHWENFGLTSLGAAQKFHDYAFHPCNLATVAPGTSWSQTNGTVISTFVAGATLCGQKLIKRA